MAGEKILVIRPENGFTSSLREAGFSVETLPLIETVPVEDLSEFRRAIDDLGNYDGLFFTSAAAVEVVLENGERELRDFRGKIYVVGERSRHLLGLAGVSIHGDAAKSARQLIASFPSSEFEDKRLLYFRGDRSLGTIAERLKDIALLREMVVYRTVYIEPSSIQAEETRKMLTNGDADWVCFFSPSAVDAFRKVTGDAGNGRLKAATIGETTAERARTLGYNVAFVSPFASAKAFAKGLRSILNAN